MENFKEKKRFLSPPKPLNYFRLLLATVGFVLVFLSQAPAARAASLYLSPAAGNYEINKTFSINILVSSPDQAMNAASGVISFPADKLEVVSLSKNGSIFSLWVQEPTFSNSTGSVNFEGIVMNPGFNGSSGKVITINFKVKAGGQANLNFFSGSILANDGKGTNILDSLGGAKFNIASPTDIKSTPTPVVKEQFLVQLAATKDTAPATKDNKTPVAPKISSSTHPDQEKWYANNNPEISWGLPAGINGMSVYLSQNPTSNLRSVSDGFFRSKSYENIEDGIWYFHIKFRNQNGWGDTSHFRFQIDTEPPAPFVIEFIDGREVSKPQIRIALNVIDNLSGIDYYTIEYGNKDSLKVSPAEITANNPYVLPPLPLGKQQIKVSAFDKAGNFTSVGDEFTIKPITAPEIIDYSGKLVSGGTLNIAGKTIYPDSEIVIWLQKDKNEPQEYTSQSDQEGQFTFNQEKIDKGVYQIWAKATNKQGGQSDPSEKVIIIVKEPTLVGLGDKIYETWSLVIRFLILFIPLIVLLLLLALLLWYGWQKFSKLKIKAAEEIRLVKKTFQKEFKKSKKDIQKRIEILERNQTKRRLVDEAEKKIIKQLKKELINLNKSGKKKLRMPGRIFFRLKKN